MTFLYDQLIKGATVVRPKHTQPEQLDIAIRDGRFVAIEAQIDATLAKNVTDARGLLAFPGLVDPHRHTGIYAPLNIDARNESRAAAMGGVTSSLNYIRTG